ncbi:hypothetical protein P5G50_06265 [Leifsonia sp. F6_8S_P_1B]|uniref:RNA polymerase sigma-70 factor, ECF subfamily n=1 Tax=Leifsonia williamsii TaxID=3035919 RepID=A0ABT8KB59_9MICO|nr:hypothetical protein [Leifsonia williamsii]MDN4614056.1 hypothetical protein [Leifsonia williamsii]
MTARGSGCRRRRRRWHDELALARLVAGFRDAYAMEDLAALARILGPWVRIAVDAGEQATAPPPALGVIAVIGLLHQVLGPPGDLTLEVRSVNGGPGLLVTRCGDPVAVVVLRGRVGAVTDLWVVADPGKLLRWR